MQEKKFRHELKHYINWLDVITLRQRLKAVAHPDNHANADGKYHIRSLYFDNFDNKVLREKLDGVNHREKFRLRYYNHNPSWIRLEKKEKINGLCCKIAAPITQAECQNILQGDWEWMAHSKQGLILELYSKMRFQNLRPRTIVDYIREPFVYEPGNVRVTLDYEIQTGNYSLDFFNPALPTLSTCGTGTAVLEVKYDAFLPRIIADIVQTKSRPAAAFSKYVAARVYEV